MSFLTISSVWNNKSSIRLKFADIETLVTSIWNSIALSSKGWRETGTPHISCDEGVTDEVNRASAIFVAGVNAAVSALGGRQGSH